MSTPSFYRLNSLSVLDVIGVDAEKIVHNLTTNDVKTLTNHQGCESFVTDVKGKTLGHAFIYRCDECFRLIGAQGQSERVASHVDRYTIVEDAAPTVGDHRFVAFVVAPDATAKLDASLAENTDQLREVVIAQLRATAYGVAWLGSGTVVLLCAAEDAQHVQQELIGRAMVMGDEANFHRHRIMAGFPWWGVDFDDKNLPQEADRNTAAICFTKGCYLGQETVARLDAMGQVQKKLVRWSLSGTIPTAPAELFAAEQKVGRLTSVAPTSENEAIAIGMARRSHFDAGAQASGGGGDGTGEFIAVVL